jgi:hypothetical protein
MVIRGRARGVPVTASLKDTSISLAADERYVASWDLGGRLYSAWRFGHTWRRGLNGQVLYKTRDEQGGAARGYDARQRRTLTAAEAAAVVDEAAAFARDVLASIEQERRDWPDLQEREGAAARGLMSRLRLCVAFDASRAESDASEFSRVYRPIGILPPDQYLSIVFQATEGCSFGTCTFCDLYHDGYRVKPAGEFASHVRAVVEYLGDSILLRRRSIFLGAANALAVPMPRLLELFEVLREELPVPIPPVRAFVDAFTGVRKEASDYERLRDLGLGRVYVGLESGHDPLLAFVRKPGTSAQAVETARALKAAGVGVGAIVMIGLGGREFAAGHVADTAAAVNAMGLGEGDILYFSDLVEVPGTAYPVIAGRTGLAPLELPERLAQLDAIRSRLRFGGRGPQVARYDIREFVY